eukprot:12151024-Heterocapsa_arctica.AAC.1
MYEQMSLLTIHYLRVPDFPPPIVLPAAAGCVEQGTEAGAWTSVHSAWEPESPVPEGLEPVSFASVRYLLDQMPDPDRNHEHLR